MTHVFPVQSWTTIPKNKSEIISKKQTKPPWGQIVIMDNQVHIPIQLQRSAAHRCHDLGWSFIVCDNHATQALKLVSIHIALRSRNKAQHLYRVHGKQHSQCSAAVIRPSRRPDRPDRSDAHRWFGIQLQSRALIGPKLWLGRTTFLRGPQSHALGIRHWLGRAGGRSQQLAEHAPRVEVLAALQQMDGGSFLGLRCGITKYVEPTK